MWKVGLQASNQCEAHWILLYEKRILNLIKSESGVRTGSSGVMSMSLPIRAWFPFIIFIILYIHRLYIRYGSCQSNLLNAVEHLPASARPKRSGLQSPNSSNFLLLRLRTDFGDGAWSNGGLAAAWNASRVNGRCVSTPVALKHRQYSPYLPPLIQFIMLV